DLAQALMLAHAAGRSEASAIAGYAAECDIADKIGDETMLERCTHDLERVAPGQEETLRARAALDARRPGFAMWLGWIAIAAACALRVRGALRRSMRAPVAASIAAILVTFAAPASAQDTLSEWPVNDKDPVSSVPSNKDRDANPLQFGYWLMDAAQ